MRRTPLLAGGAILLLWALLVPVAAFPQAQLPARNGAVIELLEQGQQLEFQRRWAEALAHYEDAVRQYPDDSSLERRFEFARLHYDLARRYHDATFCQSAERMSSNEALDLYGEVLLKIQTHYVEATDWRELVQRGLRNLDVALSESMFLERNVPAERRSAVDQFRSELQRVFESRPIISRAEAREAALWTAQFAQGRLAITPAPVILEMLCGATNALDPYSTFLTPSQLTEVYSQIEGNFVGLGVELKAHQGDLLVVRVIPHSPAQANGICAGDRILAVGDRLTRQYNTDQAANLLQGPVGSTVELTVASPGQDSRQLRIQRQRIEVPSIDEARIIDATRGIAYLKLVCFQKNTARELDSALWQLHREGMRSLIVDLRGNPGGLLVTSVEVADKFLDRGVIVITRGRNAAEDFTYSAHEEGTWRVPLVLLIDQDSASAAEIFAGAIRDHRRGVVVGTRSYGKGSIQGIFPLNTIGAGVRLTTARFYSPIGRPYSRFGVEPEVAVHRTARPVSNTITIPEGEDTMLTTALQTAAQRFAPR